MREFLLDSVSLIRILRSVPAGTSGTTLATGRGRLFNPGLVWANATGASPKINVKSNSVCNLL
jgi:hypothetical protein